MFLRLEDDLIMDSDGTLAVLDFSTFFFCIGGSIEEIFLKNKMSHEVNLKIIYCLFLL